MHKGKFQASDKCLNRKEGLIMANISRKLGVNICELIRKADISLDSFAKELGYTEKDTWNMIEGKVLIPPMELERIVGFLKTSKSALLNYETDLVAPELQYMKKFRNPDNLDRILDLMDEYVECRECV